MSRESYRSHFEHQDAAATYDQRQYADASYSAFLWEIEKIQLEGLIAAFRRTHQRINYLDFACGTGRVISFLESRVDAATGIEISSTMADRARSRIKSATIHCMDITAQGQPVESSYDLITAFRFILNAEPELRVAALNALAARLRDDSSWLIFNNHGNVFSHKLALQPYHRLRRGFGHHHNSGNYLSNRSVYKLARDAGLRIEQVFGAGLLGGKLTKLVPAAVASRIEHAAASSRLLRPILVNQMYVARREA